MVEDALGDLAGGDEPEPPPPTYKCSESDMRRSASSEPEREEGIDFSGFVGDVSGFDEGVGDEDERPGSGLRLLSGGDEGEAASGCGLPRRAKAR